jgi:hypothetical protein
MFSMLRGPFALLDGSLQLSPVLQYLLKTHVGRCVFFYLLNVSYWFAVTGTKGSDGGSVCMPGSVIDAGVLFLQSQIAQPRVLAVIDEQLGGRVRLCIAHGSD